MVHPNREELGELIALAEGAVPRGLYEDYKGDRYRVIGHYILETSDLAGVQYHPENDSEITWVRPVLSWAEHAVVDGHRVKRFTKISE